ncbi:MAG: enoyl-CoA hydratase-related protein [Acidimicrobiales bacterium]
MSDDVLVERSDGLVTVTFNRPERKNALDAGCWQALDAVLAEVATSAADRALLLTGAGDNFSSGADLSGDGSGGLAGGEMQLIVTEMRIVGEIIRRLQRLPKPTLAAVDGFAVGVAFGLALACDLVVASDRARFCAIFAKRGLALDGGSSWTLPRQIGLRRAKQMAYFGDMVEAPQALDWGLVNEVVPAEELVETARAWARRLADGPTTALSLSKRLLDASAGSSFEEALEGEARSQHITYTTADMGEGISAFLERREPRFTGK